MSSWNGADPTITVVTPISSTIKDTENRQDTRQMPAILLPPTDASHPSVGLVRGPVNGTFVPSDQCKTGSR